MGKRMRGDSYVQNAPDTRKILSTSTPDQHYTVVLQVVALSRNICLYGLAGRQLHSGHLPLSGVGLLRLCDEDLADNALLLRVPL